MNLLKQKIENKDWLTGKVLLNNIMKVIEAYCSIYRKYERYINVNTSDTNNELDRTSYQ